IGWRCRVYTPNVDQVKEHKPVFLTGLSSALKVLPMRAGVSVTGLIQLLRSDDKSVRDMAARLIWQRYFPDLLDLARKNLDRRVRRRADEEDVVQSMFRSFCARQKRGDFELAGRDDLWRLLVTITIRKARNTTKAHRRERRDIAREQVALQTASDD